MKGLTPKQLGILQYIERYIQEHHYSPSYREIMAQFNFNSPGTVYKHIQMLILKGALSKEKQSRRSIHPIRTPQPILASNEIQLPLIANLSAGYPLELFVQSQMISVPSSLVHNPDSTYILQTQGDSLQDEWILDGDLLLIEARQDIQPGEIILGLINQHDTVLKRYYPEGQYIRLESQHPNIRPLTVRTEHITIQGVMVGLLRVY